MPLRQDIRFCTTRDGVRIAHAASGTGPPLVRAGTWMNHLEVEAQEADSVVRFEQLGRRNTVIRYDARGSGLSDRHVPEITFEGFLADLEAVVDARELATFSLLGVSAGAALSLAYAVKHPQRVERVVILNGFARSYFSASTATAELRAEAELILRTAQQGWESDKPFFREMFVRQLVGPAAPKVREEVEHRMRASMTGEMAARHLRCNYATDVLDLAGRVACPVLVFHSRSDEMVLFEQGRKLAAGVPGSRFVPLEASAHYLLTTDPAYPVFQREMEAFLHPGEPAGARLTPRQAEVLTQVSVGQTDKEIARALQLSPRTVEMHVAGAMKALDCATRAEAVAKAAAAGLLP